MDKCPVTGQSAMSQETAPKTVKQSNPKTSDVNQEVMARKAEIFDIQVGQDTLKIKWDELEKLKAQRLNDLKEILQSAQDGPKVDQTQQQQAPQINSDGPKASPFGKLPVIEVDE